MHRSKEASIKSNQTHINHVSETKTDYTIPYAALARQGEKCGTSYLVLVVGVAHKDGLTELGHKLLVSRMSDAALKSTGQTIHKMENIQKHLQIIPKNALQEFSNGAAVVYCPKDD